MAAGIQNGAGNWDTPSFTYETGAKNSRFCQGCNVAFGKAGSTGAGGTVTLTDTQRINSFLFDTGPTSDYTLSGGTLSCTNTSTSCTYTTNRSGTINSTIPGSKGLIKEGDQTLTLSGANTYSGSTTIIEGTLKLVNSANEVTSATTINSGAMLEMNATANQPYDPPQFFNSTVSGAGNISVSGNGASWIGITPTNFPLTGPINVLNNGRLFFWWGLTTMAAVDVAAGGQLATGNRNASIGTLTGGGDIFQGYNGTTQTLSIGSDDGSGTFSGIIHGNGSSGVRGNLETGFLGVTKNGTGTQTLSGNNTFSSTLTINTGTLTLGNGTTTGNIIPSSNLITNNSTLIYNTPSNITHSGIISGTGAFTKQGTGALTLTGLNSDSGNMTITQGRININGDMANTAFPTIDTALGTTFALNVANSGWLGAAHTIQGSGNVVLGANMAINNLNITNDSNSILTINAGADVINNSCCNPLQNFGGELNILGTFTSGSNTIGLKSITGNGALNHTTGTVTYNINPGGTFSGTVNIENTSIFNITGTQTLSGVVSSWGGITKTGSGTLNLTAVNTYTGALNINGGTVYASYGGIGSPPTVTLNGGNLTLVNNVDTNYTPNFVWNQAGTLNFTQPDFGHAWTLSGTLTVNAAATITGNKGTGSIIINGVISGAGSVIYTATNPTTVNGNNTYTGGTTLNAPANVTCGQANALGTVGVITVNAGATLRRNGTNCGGARVVGAGTIIP